VNVLVVGLDGADWRLLQPWLDQGKLPTIAGLAAAGAVGRLRSTIRPESSVAWSSFATGVNPGKHGVFGFARRLPGSYRFRLASGSSIRVCRFWDLAGGQGLRVGLLNVPFTYPPSAVNGFMVTGMLTPGVHVPFTYPPHLQRELLDRFDGYAFDVGDWQGDKAALVERARALTRQQRDMTLFLLREQPWDLAVTVFTAPDRLQHFLWADADERHPAHNPQEGQRFGGALLEHYRSLDDAIGAVLETLPDDTLLLLVSDHGCNGCMRRFSVNRWLAERGLLALKRGGRWQRGVPPLLSHLGSLRPLRRVKQRLFPARWSLAGLRCGMFARAVDWARTRAWFGPDGGVWVNLRGREPQGIVSLGDYDAFREELRRELLAVRDPETGRPVLSSVFLREELYHGPAAGAAPDLIAEPRRGEEAYRHNVILDGTFEPGDASPFGSSLPYTGNHTLEGVVLAWGKGVAGPQPIRGAHITDLAPTVLAALGVAVPTHMDGRALPALLAGREHAHPRTSARSWATGPGPPFGPADEAVVEDRLANLGYLS